MWRVEEKLLLVRGLGLVEGEGEGVMVWYVLLLVEGEL